MAYKRRYRKPKPWYNKKHSVGDVAMAAWKGVKLLKGLVNAELHQKIFATSGVIDNAGSITPLHNIDQGDYEGARTGNSILAKSIKGNISFLSGTAVGTVVRVIIFQDNQQEPDANPVVNDVLQGGAISGLALNSTGRFTILSDRKILLDNYSQKYKLSKINIRRDHHIRYNGTTQYDIQKGGWYMLLLSNTVAGASSPTVDFDLRTAYYDN